MKTREITLLAVLTAAALALSLIERLFPLGLIIPVPGIRLGLSNIVIMFVLFYFGIFSAASVLTCRLLIVFLITGNITSLILSASGGFIALFCMFLFKKGYNRTFSVYGISIAGACAHNFGQVIAASAIMASGAVFYYLPVLLLTGLFTGFVTAALTSVMFIRFDKQKNIKGHKIT